MRRWLEITLGIVTSVGGFLEAGSAVTAAQAGAEFHYELAWAIGLGTLCLIFLVEMSGRLAALSGHSVAGAIRERFGLPFFSWVLVAVVPVMLLVLAAELGGVCLALQIVTGIHFAWFAIPAALGVWLYIWLLPFGLVEKIASLLGLVTIAFAVGAVREHPDWALLGHDMLPRLPGHDTTRYWFIAVSILGASISPYMLFFYSAGAVEEQWGEKDIPVNRVVAILGMVFGGLLSVAILVLAAHVFGPRGIKVNDYEILPALLTDPLGRGGVAVFAAALGVACFGAAVELALATGYVLADGFGWNFTKNQPPSHSARFSLAYTAILALAAVPILFGVPPLSLTVISMVITAASLPFSVLPFLVLLNDEQYVGDHRNGFVGNTVVLFTTVMAFVLAVVSLPLQLFGGSSG